MRRNRPQLQRLHKPRQAGAGAIASVFSLRLGRLLAFRGLVGGGLSFRSLRALRLGGKRTGAGEVRAQDESAEDEPASEPSLTVLWAEVADVIGLPEGWGTAAYVPIGWPASKGHGPIARRSVEKMAYADTFGQALEIDSRD